MGGALTTAVLSDDEVTISKPAPTAPSLYVCLADECGRCCKERGVEDGATPISPIRGGADAKVVETESTIKVRMDSSPSGEIPPDLAEQLCEGGGLRPIGRGQLMALQLVLMRGGEGQSPRESSGDRGGDSCPYSPTPSVSVASPASPARSASPTGSSIDRVQGHYTDGQPHDSRGAAALRGRRPRASPEQNAALKAEFDRLAAERAARLSERWTEAGLIPRAIPEVGEAWSMGGKDDGAPREPQAPSNARAPVPYEPRAPLGTQPGSPQSLARNASKHLVGSPPPRSAASPVPPLKLPGATDRAATNHASAQAAPAPVTLNLDVASSLALARASLLATTKEPPRLTPAPPTNPAQVLPAHARGASQGLPGAARAPEPPRDATRLLFALGGDEGGAGSRNTVEGFDRRRRTWTQIAELRGERYWHAGAALDSHLYVMGGKGERGTSSRADVDRYDLETGWWFFVGDMSLARHWHAAGALGGGIYAVGGVGPDGPTATAERFDPQTELWADVAPMARARYGHAVAVLDGRLHAVGGADGRSVECFDPEANAWSAAREMRAERVQGAAAVGMHGCLYVTGGRGSQREKVLSCMERYDPREGRWEHLAPMERPRYFHGMAVLGGVLYALGGSDGQAVSSTAEHYDLKANRWFQVPSMGRQRWQTSAVVLDVS